MNDRLRQEFQEHERSLWALLYRMTGSSADADDLLQETFKRAIERPPPRLDLPLKPWLAKVALNLARDHLRARKRDRYAGQWLPSPIETKDETSPPSFDPGAEWRYDQLESVSYAFLLALEALTPFQRAVLLLRDVFDYSVRETAEALDLSEANAKQLHLRAKKKMEAYHKRRSLPTAELQAETMRILHEFVQRIITQDVAGIEAMLAVDARVINDSAGEFHAATRTVRGARKVARFLAGVTKKRGDVVLVEVRVLNGSPALLVQYAFDRKRDAMRTTFSIELDQKSRITTVYSVLATRKLSRLEFGKVG
jgi:RNA polymerase sigma-70 factor, ECF subfamily